MTSESMRFSNDMEADDDGESDLATDRGVTAEDFHSGPGMEVALRQVVTSTLAHRRSAGLLLRAQPRLALSK